MAPSGVWFTMEFINSFQPPALFQDGLLRKNKSDMSIALKESVKEHSLTTSDNTTVVIDGGHLLNTINWPTDTTYHKIAANYVKHVCTQFTGMLVVVVFYGYGSAATSTKSIEHQRRTQKTASRDILFNASMNPFVPQHSFLMNLTSKTHLISIITQCFVNDCVLCKQVEGDAVRLIVSTALEVSNLVLVVATDTDILVLLVNQASGIHGGVYMGRGLTSCLNVLDIQEKIGIVKTHLLFIRVAQDDGWLRERWLPTVAGEQFLITLYGGDRKTTLDAFILYLHIYPLFANGTHCNMSL